jgi:hypothetical protein
LVSPFQLLLLFFVIFSLLFPASGYTLQMLTTGVHWNRPASRGTPWTTSKLYLAKGRSRTSDLGTPMAAAIHGTKRRACGAITVVNIDAAWCEHNAVIFAAGTRGEDLLGSEALGLGRLGRGEELLDLGRQWPHGLDRRRCRRQGPAALLPRQIRLQIGQLAVRMARWRRFSPEFREKNHERNDVRSTPESIIQQNSRETRENSPTSLGSGRIPSW